MLDIENLKTSLKEEFGYPDFLIQSTVEKLINMNESLKTAFENWYISRIVPDVTVEGYSMNVLLKDYSMQVVGAFLTLDWLLKEPQAAKCALKAGIK